MNPPHVAVVASPALAVALLDESARTRLPAVAAVFEPPRVTSRHVVGRTRRPEAALQLLDHPSRRVIVVTGS